MDNLFKSIRKMVINEKTKQKSQSNKEEAYLSQAIEMIDLERRQTCLAIMLSTENMI